MRKVFLEKLPTGGFNRGSRFNWDACIGCEVEFVYDDIKGIIKIEQYDGVYLYIKYLDKELFRIGTGNFKKCAFGNILGVYTGKFKVEIGQTFKDNKRDIIITDREIRTRHKKDKSKCDDKYYKYTCNVCGWTEGWMIENCLLKKTCCSCCSGHTIIENINSIWRTDRWMCDLGISDEDAKTHTRKSNKHIYPICPICNRIKTKSVSISNIHKTRSISCSCGDGIEYPSKVMISVLEQLKIDFKTEYAPKWCKYINYKDSTKTKTGRYDFRLKGIYINGRQVIIETDGEWHKIDNKMSGQTKEESKYIDDEKDRLALEHSCEVIRIDCEKSELNFIKQNILDSELNNILDLSKIDWNEVEKFALGNLAKQACDYKKNNINMRTSEIAKAMNLSVSTIKKYLKKGIELGWCDNVSSLNINNISA